MKLAQIRSVGNDSVHDVTVSGGAAAAVVGVPIVVTVIVTLLAAVQPIIIVYLDHREKANAEATKLQTEMAKNNQESLKLGSDSRPRSRIRMRPKEESRCGYSRRQDTSTRSS